MKKVLIGILIAAVVVSVGCGSNPDAQKYIENNTPKSDMVNEETETKEEVNEVEYTLSDYITFRSGLENTIGLDENTCHVLYNWCKENEDIMTFEKALEPNIFDICPELLDK